MPQDAARCPGGWGWRGWPRMPPKPDPWDAINLGIVFSGPGLHQEWVSIRWVGEGALGDGGERCARYPTDERPMGRMSYEPCLPSSGTLLTRLCHPRGPF